MAKTASPSDPAIYCRKCSYDLRGQEEHRCPECGLAYDPADKKSFRRRPRRAWVKKVIVASVVLILIAAAPFAWLYWEWRREQPAVRRIKEVGNYVGYKRIEVPGLTRVLPQRFGWLFDRVDEIYGGSITATDDDLVLFGRCPQLRYLALDSSLATEKGVKALGPLSRLQDLTMNGDGDGVTDASAAQLAQCRELRDLRLARTALGDAGLAHLCRLPQLRILHLQSPSLTDAGLGTLANLPQLGALSLRASSIGDEGLAALSRLSGLRSLNISADHYTPAGEERLRKALPNCTITVGRYSPTPASSPCTAPCP